MESAFALGQSVRAFDLFNDWDMERFQEKGGALKVQDMFSSSSQIQLRWQDICRDYKKFDIGPIIFCGPVEATPEIIEEASVTFEVWNAPADAIRKCRELAFLKSLADEDIFFPSINFDGSGRWIKKNLFGAGGTSIFDYHGEELAEDEYAQKYIGGTSIGAVYYTSASGSRLLGITRHINAHPGFRQPEFSFGGIVYPAVVDDQTTALLSRFGERVGKASGLLGFWGADFTIGADKKIGLLEINPRPTASLELVAKEHAIDIVSLQRDAVMGNRVTLKQFDNHPKKFTGTAVCYADCETVFSAPEFWFQRGGRDLPFDGAVIRKGEPILSLYADSDSYENVLLKLENYADNLYRKDV